MANQKATFRASAAGTPVASRRQSPLRGIAALFIVVLVAPRRAAADTQLWTGLEARVPISDGRYGAPTHARWVTESRFGGLREGLSFVLARLGLMWELSPNVLLNLNGVQASASDALGVMRSESRVEVEPNVRGRIGDFGVNLRQRAELRWNRAEPSYRYRAQLRWNYQPRGARLAPFLSTELFVVTRARLLETRNVLGVSVFATKHLRLDLGYMLRPQQSPDGWLVSHIGLVTVTFAPDLAPVLESGGG